MIHFGSKNFEKYFVWIILAAAIKSEDAPEVEDSKEALEVKETETVEPIPETDGDNSGSKPKSDPDENGSETTQSTFTYDELKAKSDNPVTGIDFKSREVRPFFPIRILCLQSCHENYKEMQHWYPTYCQSSKLTIDL